jgi:hypothetical protein
MRGNVRAIEFGLLHADRMKELDALLGRSPPEE